jgi:glycerate 2-kinase
VPRSSLQLRADAQSIWWAGVRAVLPERLVRRHVRVDGHTLSVGGVSDGESLGRTAVPVADSVEIDLRGVRRIAIVGAGKAAGALAVAVEDVLGPQLLEEKQVDGWVNVPADCLQTTQRVRLHAARPAGVNEPRPAGVEGTDKILELVASLHEDDLCLCVVTGGGSALLPAPVPEVPLADKVRLIRRLSAAGADIRQLNTVRRPLSRVKGGGLARHCRAGRLISLILSDVLGDSLADIASGPTVPGTTTAGDALAVLQELNLSGDPELASIVQYLRHRHREDQAQGAAPQPVRSQVTNLVIGNNALAVAAAGDEAIRLGYVPSMVSADRPEGPAEEVGRHLAGVALHMRGAPGPDCLVSGGEPTVELIDESQRGKGGRNQQLALAALMNLGDCRAIALLSGGTDGEDGPTDAAGAVVTEEVVQAARERQLDPVDTLRRNDAYSFFSAAGGLLVTGPTRTNVCDLRVVTVEKKSRA